MCICWYDEREEIDPWPTVHVDWLLHTFAAASQSCSLGESAHTWFQLSSTVKGGQNAWHNLLSFVAIWINLAIHSRLSVAWSLHTCCWWPSILNLDLNCLHQRVQTVQWLNWRIFLVIEPGTVYVIENFTIPRVETSPYAVLFLVPGDTVYLGKATPCTRLNPGPLMPLQTPVPKPTNSKYSALALWSKNRSPNC